MIKLSMPSESQCLFAVLGQYLVGPFGPDGTEPTDVSIRSSLDSLLQGKSLYHENDVDHSKYTGHLRVIPGYDKMRATPGSNTPDAVTLDAFIPAYNYNGSVTYTNGLAVTGKATSEKSNNFFTNRVVISSSSHHVEFIEIVAQRNYPTLSPHVYRRNYFIPSLLTVNKYGRVQVKSIESLYHASLLNGDWSRVRSSADILGATDIPGRPMPVYQSAEQAVLYRVIPLATLAPSTLFTRIDSLVSKLLRNSDSPLLLAHFGDLAAKASEGVNRNDVNMIAFLKDLRKPQELIPKLKNLTSLKTHSGNYLAVNYGILPTISDLQGIMGALKKIKPYIDKNGFSTYNAVHRDSSSAGVYSYELEQRIKIAIDDEDSQFMEVLNKLESSGFAPTLENIWDLIPYSFIVDWFIDIGGLLERIDTTFRIERMNIRYATCSTKQTTSTFLALSSTNNMTGTISVVNYHRRVTDHCPLPPLSLSSENKLPNHWLEASALIIQRTK